MSEDKKDSVKQTIIIALLLSLICSIVVSVSAVKLKPIQEKNKALDKKKNILMAAGLFYENTDIEQEFQNSVKAKVVKLSDGKYADEIDPNEYQQFKVAKDSSQNIKVEAAQDIAGVRFIAPHAVVYEIIKDGNLDQVVLPIYGKGLWSTLYGFIALSADGSDVNGLGFYEHGETPGLGGEVDNPKWKQLWVGKKVFDEHGEIRIEVVKGQVDSSRPEAQYQVDGLSGATITSRGVNNLVRFWLGDIGFAKYIERLKTQGGQRG